MMRKYKLIPVIFVAVILVHVIFLLIADVTVTLRNNWNRNEFDQGYAYYTPYPNNQTWEIGRLFIDIPSLSSAEDLILMGASTTRMGILPDQLDIPPQWKLTNLGMGGDTIDSFRILWNYINTYAEHKPDKNDLVEIDIFYAAFANQPYQDRQWIQTLQAFGPYQIDDSLHVSGTMPGLITQLKLNIYKMRLALGMFLAPPGESVFSSAMEIVQNITNSINGKKEITNIDTANPETVAEMRDHWTAWTANTTFPGQSTDDFKQFLKEMNAQTNVIVVNLYIPSWHRVYAVEKEYEQWIENDLIPFLNQEGIPFTDFSTTIPDSQYGDTHLSKEGRETYTQEYNEMINPILSEISP